MPLDYIIFGVTHVTYIGELTDYHFIQKQQQETFSIAQTYVTVITFNMHL